MIRPFHPADLETCAHLLIAAYNSPPWHNQWTIATATKYLSEFVANDHFVGFISCENAVIVDAMFAHRKTWWTNDELLVDGVYITPQRQRQEVGVSLLAHAEAYAKAEGLAGLTLLTNRYLPAKDFYEKHGYLPADHLVFMYKEL